MISHFFHCSKGSRGVVVKLLACEAKCPWFDPLSSCYNFRYWLPFLPNRDMAERSLKRRKSSKQTIQPTSSLQRIFCSYLLFSYISSLLSSTFCIWFFKFKGSTPKEICIFASPERLEMSCEINVNVTSTWKRLNALHDDWKWLHHRRITGYTGSYIR